MIGSALITKPETGFVWPTMVLGFGPSFRGETGSSPGSMSMLGSSARRDRPELDRLLRDLDALDCVVVPKLDRLGEAPLIFTSFSRRSRVEMSSC